MSKVNRCCEAFLALLEKPTVNGHRWTELAERGLLIDALLEGVRSDSPIYLQTVSDMVDDERLSMALNVVAGQRGMNGASPRLIRNVRALVSSAWGAWYARRISDGETDQKSRLQQALETTIYLLDEGSRQAARYRAPMHLPGITDAAHEVLEALREVRTPNVGHVAAQYWALYWIDRASGESPKRLPDLIRDSRVVWVAAAETSGRGAIRQLHLESVAEGSLAQLFEHPENSIIFFGPSLVEAIRKSWHLLSRPPAVCWRLPQTFSGTQDGDSLSGAAVLALHSLADGSHYQSKLLVLARVASDGRGLEPVGGLKEKLDAAKLPEIDTVLIGAGESGDPMARRERIHLTGAEYSAYSARLRIVLAGNLEEGIRVARGWQDPTASRTIGGYEKVELKEPGRVSETWVATKDGEQSLLKVWPFKPQEEFFLRASWDRELRTLYRVCTSARAEKSLISLRDAFIDQSCEVFAMAFRSTGSRTLAEALASRERYRWLRMDSLSTPSGRESIWQGLNGIAKGIVLLHQQQIVHRNVCAEQVFFDEAPDSFRLGGFAWSIRLGNKAAENDITAWATPPEFATKDPQYTIDTDWYGFGMLIARCFYGLEPHGFRAVADLNRAVRDAISSDKGVLSAAEHRLVLRLIEPSSGDRLRDHDEILRLIDEILTALNTGLPADRGKREPLCVVFDHKNDILRATCEQHGFVPNRSDPFLAYSARNANHAESLKQHLREQFSEGTVYCVPGGDYWLAGRSYSLKLSSDKPPTDPHAVENWEFAFASSARPFNLPKEYESRRLEGLPVDFIFPSDPRSWREHRNWKAYLPPMPVQADRDSLQIERLQRFLRFTNQLELLMRRGEIFPCTVVPLSSRQVGYETIKVVERQIPNRVPASFELDGGMGEYFQREIDSNKRGSNQVLLTRSENLLPEFEDQPWSLEDVRAREPNSPAYLILSRRQAEHGQPSGDFFVRTEGYKGQIELIERRRGAIDRIGEHTYLLKALLGMIWMDTKQYTLHYEPPEKKVDKYKRAVMLDVLRSRPIYALQGPPGTGKTTLVSHLLREILKDDPASQILVTAQAHGAVDVLRDKVAEAFEDVPQDERPVTVRLRSRTDQDSNTQGTTSDEALRVLDLVIEQYRGENVEDAVVTAWLELANRLRLPGRSPEDDSVFENFKELVLRGANIIYSTTSAGDLERIAQTNQSFDWTVIEEAGKVHGFDLALPMQAGHRWLLVGDQYQLAPYRVREFSDGLSKYFIEAVNILQELGRTERRLIDDEWKDAWAEMKDSPESGQFQQFSQVWLRTFDRLYRVLQEVNDESLVTDTESSVGAAVGILTRQYRMHPDIGDLVSHVYYADKLHSETRRGKTPVPEILHHLSWPRDIYGKALVWIDIPWCKHDSSYEEQGPPNANRYRNRKEVDVIHAFLTGLKFEISPPEDKPLSIAILSPYNEQVSALSEMVRKRLNLPHGLRLQETIFGKEIESRRKAHTVDSFQGNQADIVLVSLVRNNLKKKIKGVGFLSERERMNVLLSRAERLLVLVGSWEFFEHQLAGFSSEETEQYTFGHLIDVMKMFRTMLNDGRAVKLQHRNGAFISNWTPSGLSADPA